MASDWKFGPVKAMVTMAVMASVGWMAWSPHAAEKDSEIALEWRGYSVLRPPVFQKDGKVLTLTELIASGVEVWRKSPPDQPVTPAPPADWVAPGFDDGSWLLPRSWLFPCRESDRTSRRRGAAERYYRVRFGVRGPPSLAMVCLRGRFTVKDPAAVKVLALSIEFRGGVAVYLNGKEIKRAHLPTGVLGPDSAAEMYPMDAHVDGKGKPLVSFLRKLKERLEKRVRTLSCELPVRALREGVNVLAIETHRAPLVEQYSKGLAWSTAGLIKLSLRSPEQAAFGPPRKIEENGVRIWNAGVMSGLTTGSTRGTGALRPIRIVAARNGTFSGQVAVACSTGTRLKEASVGTFTRKGGGTLPASIARVRYALPRRFGCGLTVEKIAWADRRAMKSNRLEILSEVPFWRLPGDASKLKAPALQPVWITVKVPADAEPGTYGGTLTLNVEGKTPARVPVELRVTAYALPAPSDYVSRFDIIQSPESLAVRYKVPSLYTEPHWRLIEKSWRLLSEIGSEVVYVPVICKTHFGNEQGMVLWKKKPDGSYGHDFTRVERYLDTVLKSGVKPSVVCLYAWEYYCVGGSKNVDRKAPPKNNPPLVSVIDEAGKIGEMKGPLYTDPAAVAFWKPVAEGFMACAKERGLGKAVMVGIIGDRVPARDGASKVWAELLPDAPWVSHSHNHFLKKGYGTVVYKVKYPQDPAIQRSFGWVPRPFSVSANVHRGWRGHSASHAHARLMNELSVGGGQAGVGRIRGDLWDIVERFMLNRYAQLSLDFGTGYELLQPGPDGPVHTVSFEMFREGIQETEARIAIEKALRNKTARGRLGAALAGKCQALLDERLRHMLWTGLSGHGNSWGEGVIWKAGAKDSGKLMNKIGRSGARARGLCGALWAGLGTRWYEHSGWQDRSERLFNMAARVTEALKADKP